MSNVSAKEVANGLVALCREGKFMDAVVAYYGENIVSVEPMAMGEHMPREVAEVSDPAMSGDEFIVKFVMDVTSKQSEERMTMEEFGVYWVQDGKIVREQFFFAD
jgi:hypothetical protein